MLKWPRYYSCPEALATTYGHSLPTSRNPPAPSHPLLSCTPSYNCPCSNQTSATAWWMHTFVCRPATTFGMPLDTPKGKVGPINYGAQSISSTGQYVILQKVIFTSKFGYLLLCNPKDKTESGTLNRWGTTNSKSLGAIIWWANQKHSAAIRSYLLHSWERGLLRLFQATTNCIIIMSQNHFPDPNWNISGIFYLFLHPILLFKITWCVPLEMLYHLHHISKMACTL